MKARVARRKLIIDIVERLVVEMRFEGLEVWLSEESDDTLIVLILSCFVVVCNEVKREGDSSKFYAYKKCNIKCENILTENFHDDSYL